MQLAHFVLEFVHVDSFVGIGIQHGEKNAKSDLVVADVSLDFGLGALEPVHVEFATAEVSAGVDSH